MKSPRGAYARRSDGSWESWSQTKQANKQRHRELYGPLPESYAAELESLAETERVRAGVFFNPSVDWQELQPRLDSRDPAVKARALTELESAIERDGAALAAELREAGLTIRQVARKAPAVHIEGSPSQVLALRSAPDEVTMVLSGAVGKAENRCNGGGDKTSEGCDVDPVEWHGIDSTFNAKGYHGKGSRIGMVEVTDGSCRFNEGHEAFEFLEGFVYSETAIQCQGAQAATAEHHTHVASVISGSYDGVTCGAGQAEIYFATDGDLESLGSAQPETVGCSDTAIVRAYEWFTDVEEPAISVVNESFGCVHQFLTCNMGQVLGSDGVTQDYFARVYGLPIVKAAGNQGCNPEDEACPFTLNSLCVGGGGQQQEHVC